MRLRILNGEFSERGLARVLGISQPQIHNLLKGARTLHIELADRLLARLQMDLMDLLDIEEIQSFLNENREGNYNAAQAFRLLNEDYSAPEPGQKKPMGRVRPRQDEPFEDLDISRRIG